MCTPTTTLDDHDIDNHELDCFSIIIFFPNYLTLGQGGDEFGVGDAESVVYNLIIRLASACEGQWLTLTHPSYAPSLNPSIPYTITISEQRPTRTHHANAQ